MLDLHQIIEASETIDEAVNKLIQEVCNEALSTLISIDKAIRKNRGDNEVHELDDPLQITKEIRKYLEKILRESETKISRPQRAELAYELAYKIPAVTTTLEFKPEVRNSSEIKSQINNLREFLKRTVLDGIKQLEQLPSDNKYWQIHFKLSELVSTIEEKFKELDPYTLASFNQLRSYLEKNNFTAEHIRKIPKIISILKVLAINDPDLSQLFGEIQKILENLLKKLPETTETD